MKETNATKTVHVREIFKKKNPKLAKLIPGFIYAYIERITHQDFINDILLNYGHLKGLEFIESVIKHFNVTITVKNEHLVPKNGRYIFASNHPLGGFDGILLMHVLGKHYGNNIRFLVNDILMNLTPFEEFFIPINKHGRQNIDAAEKITAAYESDNQILTFPAGLVSRKIKGKITDLEWKKNFILKARQYERNIIPVFVSGENTNFFYRLANIRKFLGIKANIEMFYLVDETHKHQHKHIEITFGEPIEHKTLDNSKKPMEWALHIKNKAYTLRS